MNGDDAYTLLSVGIGVVLGIVLTFCFFFVVASP